MSQTCDEHRQCSGHSAAPSVQQTLDELDFSRGIWSAAVDGDEDAIVSCLDKKNIPVDAPDSSGYTALHYACRHGHYNVCKLLLDKHASPNVQTRSGEVTPLHRAAYCGYANIVTLLLQRGADPLLQDSDGKLPLHKAAEKGHLPIVQQLVACQPSAVNHRDNRNQAPVDCVPDIHTDLKHLLKIT